MKQAVHLTKTVAFMLVLLTVPTFALATTCSSAPATCPQGEKSYYASSGSSVCASGGFYCAKETTASATQKPSPPKPTTSTQKKTPVAAKPTTPAPLSFGSRGSAVITLQQQLITLGYLAADSATGFFGNLTKQAVAQFQIDNNLEPVGYVGPKTKAALAAAHTPGGTTSTITPTITPPPAQSSNPASLLVSLLAQVKALQDKIAALKGTATTQSGTQTSGSSGGGTAPTSSAPTCTLPTPVTETRTSTQCPTGQTGTITETRTATCASGATTPVWGGWATTTNTCAPAQNDLETIQSAINAHTSGGDILLEGRTYRLDCPQAATETYCLNIQNASNITLRGIAGQTKLLVTQPHTGFLKITNSRSITLKDFSVDYEIPPFTQGTVLSVNGTSFVFRPDTGYPSPDSILALSAAQGAPADVAAVGMVFVGHTPVLKKNSQDFFYLTRSSVNRNDGTWTLTSATQILPQLVSAGDVIAFGTRIDSGISISFSADVSARNIQMYTAPSVAIVAYGNSGRLDFDQLTITPTPGTNRLLSSVADALHFQSNTAKVTLRNSTIQAMGDDAFTTYTSGMTVGSKSGLGNNQIRVGKYIYVDMFTVGDSLSITDPTKYIERFGAGGRAKITAKQDDGAYVRLTLDRAVDAVQEGDLVYDANLTAPGSEVTDNHFGPFRGVFRIRDPGTTFARNTIDDPRNAIIMVSTDVNWDEGPRASPPITFDNHPSGGSIKLYGFNYQDLGAAPNVWPPPQQELSYQASTNFSATQGGRQWSYLDSSAPMTFDQASNRWRGSEEYALLWSNGGHPGMNTDAIRRWTAPRSSSAHITGSVVDGDASCGDGVVVAIRKGATTLWSHAIANGGVSVSYDLTTTVSSGDMIDFVINRNAGDNFCDATTFDPRIIIQ